MYKTYVTFLADWGILASGLARSPVWLYQGERRRSSNRLNTSQGLAMATQGNSQPDIADECKVLLCPSCEVQLLCAGPATNSPLLFSPLSIYLIAQASCALCVKPLLQRVCLSIFSA